LAGEVFLTDLISEGSSSFFPQCCLVLWRKEDYSWWLHPHRQDLPFFLLITYLVEYVQCVGTEKKFTKVF
jgi:hypothetical protein